MYGGYFLFGLYILEVFEDILLLIREDLIDFFFGFFIFLIIFRILFIFMFLYFNVYFLSFVFVMYFCVFVIEID